MSQQPDKLLLEMLFPYYNRDDRVLSLDIKQNVRRFSHMTNGAFNLYNDNNRLSLSVQPEFFEHPRKSIRVLFLAVRDNQIHMIGYIVVDSFGYFMTWCVPEPLVNRVIPKRLRNATKFSLIVPFHVVPTFCVYFHVFVNETLRNIVDVIFTRDRLLSDNEIVAGPNMLTNQFDAMTGRSAARREICAARRRAILSVRDGDLNFHSYGKFQFFIHLRIYILRFLPMFSHV